MRPVGRYNSALRAELEDPLNGLRRQSDDVTRQADIARLRVQAQQPRIDEPGRLQEDLSWEDLDLEPATRRLTALAADLKHADNSEQRARRDAYDTAQQELFEAKSAAGQAQQHVERLKEQIRARDEARTRAGPLAASAGRSAAAGAVHHFHQEPPGRPDRITRSG